MGEWEGISRGVGAGGELDGDHGTVKWGSPCRLSRPSRGRPHCTAGDWRGRVGPGGRDCGKARQLVIGWLPLEYCRKDGNENE